MDFDQALAITAPATAGMAKRRLERALDAADEAHREAVSERLGVARYSEEIDDDLQSLSELAAVIAEAGRKAARHLNRLAENNLSVPDGADLLSASDVAARFEEALDGLLTPSAARVVGAAIPMELA